MTTYLLDASVLISLTVAEHEHHERAAVWASTIDRFAICPVVEGSLMRFLVRVGERASVAREVLRAVHALPRCEFWPDAHSYADTGVEHVIGHRQVTDAYLLGKVRQHDDAILATLDQALAVEAPHDTLLIPDGSARGTSP